MNTQTLSLRGTRTFLLGMLVGAAIVAGSLVLARGHNQVAPPAVMIQTGTLGATASASAMQPAGAELPPSIELTRAVVVGHRFKILVRGEQGSTLSLNQSSNSYL